MSLKKEKRGGRSIPDMGRGALVDEATRKFPERKREFVSMTTQALLGVLTEGADPVDVSDVAKAVGSHDKKRGGWRAEDKKPSPHRRNAPSGRWTR